MSGAASMSRKEAAAYSDPVAAFWAEHITRAAKKKKSSLEWEAKQSDKRFVLYDSE